jgi:hypothetical protein
MSLKTQGTSLFILIPGTTDTIARVTCVKEVTGVGAGAKDQIDVTCLEDTEDRQYVAGLATPSAVTMSVNYDPSDGEYESLLDLKESGDNTRFFLGLSDGAKTIAPTIVSGVVTFPSTRSFLEFQGFIAEFPFDFAQNTVITSAISVQRSGSVIRHLKA